METYVYRVDNYGRNWTALQQDNIDGYALSVLQDPVDPDLLFLGTELGLYLSLNGGNEWFKYTAGVPTVSVMDMAIQDRENDLVLGTHGRSIFIIDDYSGLRGLGENGFEQRFALLSVSNGQHYDANQTPSSRFTGTGEFRAENEPYGVMVTFMASGDDLTHPDDDKERERLIRRREAKTADEEEDETEVEEIKIRIDVTSAEGEFIRRFEHTPQQGINRVVWDMSADGVKPMPGGEEPESDVLPSGTEVPPGTYTITMTMLNAEDDLEPLVATVETVKDPRSPYSQADIEANFETLSDLQDLRADAVDSVERIVRSRDDVETIKNLIEARQESGHNDTYLELSERAGEIITELTDLEKLIRVPPETKGIVYDADKLTSHLSAAQYYVGSSRGAPSPASQAYIDKASSEAERINGLVNDYISTELATFRDAVNRAGIGLLADVDALEY